MKQIILVLAMALAMAFPMNAQEGDAGGIRAIIAAQIDAFLAEDVDTAFSYASSGIQKVFRTPERFGAMVEGGYPMVWRPAETRFLELREIDGAPWQKVLLRDSAGVWHLVDYRMVFADGAWRIDGVDLMKRAEVGA